MRMQTPAAPLRRRVTARPVPPELPLPAALPALYTVEAEPGLWAATTMNEIVGGFVTDDLARARKFETAEAADDWRVRQGYPDGKVVVWRA